MASLRVPFQGKSVQELYKKITRGVISKIPPEYSNDVSSIIKLCLTKDQMKRPTVLELLEHPIIQSKVKLYDIQIKKCNHKCGQVLGEMMGTIKLPKNLNLLIERLPRKRYESERVLQAEEQARIVPLDSFNKKLQSHESVKFIEVKVQLVRTIIISRLIRSVH